MATVQIGSFEVKSGEIQITDPCYDPETWCAGSVLAANGIWDTEVEVTYEGVWGRRVSILRARWNGTKDEPDTQLPIDVGVDSGQAGFFDKEYFNAHHGGKYGDADTFYGRCCLETHSESDPSKVAGIVDGMGVVSSSGFGDGSYIAFAKFNNAGEAIALRIEFINDDEEEEDYEENES